MPSHTSTVSPASSAKPPVNPEILAAIPALLTTKGVNQYLLPIGPTALYEAATAKEIESVSVGMGRGRRLWVTASIVAWINRRAATTKRPALAGRGASKITANGGN